MQILPSPILSGIVKHFLILESDSAAQKQHRMFSDGNTGLVFNYGDPLFSCTSDGKNFSRLPSSFFYGQLNKFLNVIPTGKVRLLVVVFHPYGAHALLGIGAWELTSNIIDSDVFYPGEVQNVLEAIATSKDALSKINFVANFLIRKIKDKALPPKIVVRAVEFIQLHHGSKSISDLSGSFDITERRLQRIFETCVGITPKQFSGVTRIQHFLKLLRKKPEQTTLTELGYDVGFYDQAHLIRELKNVSGITPGQYISKTPPLAANLISLSNS